MDEHAPARSDAAHAHGVAAHDDRDAEHAHSPGGGHGHAHGGMDSRAGLGVLARASAVLAMVAAVEISVAAASHSAAVLADGLHNLGDVATTGALAVAFVLSGRAPTHRFPYGYHRSEDVAGVVVLLLVIASAIAAGVTSVERLLHGGALTLPAWALVSALVGLVGNESVARYKIVQGRRLRSVSLEADGRHSRVDGLASLGAALGVAGSWAGLPILDPIAGLALTVVMVWVAAVTARAVLPRLLDEADASLMTTIATVAARVPGVVAVGEVRTRWTGRRLRAELVLAVDGEQTVAHAHAIGEAVRHALLHSVTPLADVVVHLDPAGDETAHAAAAHHDRGG